jgi:hypothetical protein
MKEIALSPIGYVTAAVFLLHRLVALLRAMLELRNEWYRREPSGEGP